jgi:hypothetical protein
MAARTCSVLGPCLLLAILATGCAPLRGFLNPNPVVPGDPNAANQNPNLNPNPNEHPASAGVVPTDGIPGGTVIAAGGTARGPQEPPLAMPPPPMPIPKPPTANPPAPLPANPPAPLPLPQQWPPQANAGQPQAPVSPPYSYYPQQIPFADPHVRANPTVTGGRLQLAPWEAPADRVFELTRQMEVLLAQNSALLARVKELELLGVAREQSLAEAAREIETITTAGAKERATLRTQIDQLNAKIEELEKEDIKVLEAVIEALKKLLPPEKP